MALRILLIGDERKNRRLFMWGFADGLHHVKMAGTRPAVRALVDAEPFQVVCLDWEMTGEDPAGVLAVLKERRPELPVVVLVHKASERFNPACKPPGVSAFLIGAFQIEKLHALLGAHALPGPGLARAGPAGAPPDRTTAPPTVLGMVFDDVAQRTLELAQRAARSSAAILLLGETGTGKSQLALAIHRHSAICERRFVTVNCPCLNHELLESELFGHVRGAFTGAVQDTEGKVAAAEGGTLFLDEIGDLPMSLQPKLLRLLQEKQYERLGESTSRPANVRIIAASNRNLGSEVAAGRFREDLYYRINVIAIEVPALRGRAAQIIGAAEDILAALCAQLGKPGVRFSPEARRMFERYSWPGNLRELRNVIERAVILSRGSILGPEDFPALRAPPVTVSLQIGGRVSLQALENAHIQLVIANAASLEEAARILEIDKSTLYRKRKQLDAPCEVRLPRDRAHRPLALAAVA